MMMMMKMSSSFSHSYCQLRESLHCSVSPPAGPALPLLLYPGHVQAHLYPHLPCLGPHLPCLGPLYECPFEPAFIQKRNERERQRVKCVNQGYAKLRDHLPGASADKRLSKVETLRAAIQYIKHLQRLVQEEGRSQQSDGETTPLSSDTSSSHKSTES